MKYDGKLLGQARANIAARKAANEEEHHRRVRQIHSLIPEIERIDQTLRSHMASVVSLTIRHDPDLESKIEGLKQENLNLQADRAELLVKHGFDYNYLDDLFSCQKCGDTGYVNGAPCSCLLEEYNREMTKELGTLLQTGDESFSHFDLTLYDSVPKENGDIPQENMKMVYDICKKYADTFDPGSMSMLFTGNPGVGKTYLSACIAREVAAKGYSVCYETATAALGTFETEKFSRDPEEAEQASRRTGRMLSCDLMILDDLGTEMVTPMSVSALYTLINDRLIHHRPTIISTNLAPEDLEGKYSPQIASRINGEFTPVEFDGRDIRQIKKERGLA